MTLQSNAFTAQTQPTTARIILDEESYAGATTLNTDIKAYASRDGTNFTQVTLADQGQINYLAGIDTYTKLMLHCDGTNGGTTFTDNSGSAHTVTPAGNTHTDTAVKKFGTAAGQFDGTGDYLSVPNSTNWDFGTSAFTWDLWVYVPSSLSANSVLISLSSGFDSFIRVMSNGHLQMRVGGGNSSQADGGTAGADIADDTWHHVAAVRESATSLKVYLDGTLDHSNTVSSADVQTSGTLTIGAHSNASNPFAGYMDEIRISKDIARSVSYTHLTLTTTPYV